MRSIALFAKAPVPGKVKTRLASSLSPDASAAFHKSFVIDTLTEISALSDVDLFLACHPIIDDPFFNSMKKRFSLTCLEQKGSDLGERMENTFKHLMLQNYEKIVVIGSDSPTLSRGIIERAFESLEKHRLVLGPSIDGGYYLIGISKEVPEVFKEIEWGSENVFDDTLRKAKCLGLEVDLLPFWYDVDTIKELRFLSIHLELMDKRACLETRNMLARIEKNANYSILR